MDTVEGEASSVFVPIAKPKPKRQNYVKKVEHDWTHEEILKLIAAVKERRVLWDCTMPQYRLKTRPKTDGWKQVADIIGSISVDDAKGKWMNLRISFKNNLAKYRAKKSKRGIQWRYFKRMLFLEAYDVQQSTESTSSFSLASANTDASAVNDLSETLLPPSFNETGKRERCSTPGPTPSPSPRSTQGPTPSPTPTNISMREVAFNALNSLRERDDKFSAYGEYIASELRTLPSDRAHFVQSSLTRELLRLLEAGEFTAPPPVSCSPVHYVDVEVCRGCFHNLDRDMQNRRVKKVTCDMLNTCRVNP